MPSHELGLGLGLALLVIDFVAWRSRWPPGDSLRLAVRSIVFLGLSYALWLAGVNPVRTVPDGINPVVVALETVLSLAWWFQAAHITAVLVTRFVLPPTWKRERLSQDVAHAIVFLLAILGAATCLFDLPIRALLATSGAVAIVLGLAVQSTLSDVFSGLVLNATRPFQIGDLVRVGDTEGKVIERSWRATTLLGDGGNFVVVPNASAARANIVNFNQPAHIHGLLVPFKLSSVHSPTIVLAALRDATLSMASLGANPPPTVAAISVTDKSVTYEISAYVASISERINARTELLERAYQHLAAAGIIRTQVVQEPPQQQAATQLLASLDLFQTLSHNELTSLADQVEWVSFEAGETVYEADGNSPENSTGLLIIAAGVAVLFSTGIHPEREIRRLAPGEAIGRASILAGVSVDIRLKALTRVQAIRLDKTYLSPILRARPEVSRRMLQSLLDYKAKAAANADALTLSAESQSGFVRRLLLGMRLLHGVTLGRARASTTHSPT